VSGGYGDRRVWRPAAGLSLVYSRRGVLVTGLLLIAGLVIACITMVTGQYALSPSGVWQALFGEVDPIDQLVVLGLRLPRVLTALLVGASLGVAGGIFQSIARNPLASPDIIGFTTGSATGALAVILIAGESGLSIGLGAVLGASPPQSSSP